jgi:hypothetical protein
MFGLFRRKVTLDVPDGKGGTRKVRVPEKQLDEWIRTGAARQLVKVLVHDIDRGEVEEMWEIGKSIDRETYERLKDSDGRLYAMTHYENGEKVLHVTTFEMYQGVKAALRAQGLD